MGGKTELRVRGDWQFVRFVYLPAAAVGMTPLHPCALCTFCWWWGHHLEEWISRKAIFQITDAGLRYEDGGKPIHYRWSDIQGVVLHRRSPIPFWRTDGDVKTGKPPFWLAITLREGGKSDDKEEPRTICVWPRQVVGGLYSLMRFAKELQRQLIERANHGEIPRLMPERSK